jgi:hypothetical protein
MNLTRDIKSEKESADDIIDTSLTTQVHISCFSQKLVLPISQTCGRYASGDKKQLSKHVKDYQFKSIPKEMHDPKRMKKIAAGKDPDAVGGLDKLNPVAPVELASAWFHNPCA